jgi:hypothetical protein
MTVVELADIYWGLGHRIASALNTIELRKQLWGSMRGRRGIRL